MSESVELRSRGDAAGSSNGRTENPLQSNSPENNPDEAFIKEVVSAVRKDILGNDVVGWKKLFYVVDPFRAEQTLRCTKSFDNSNVIFGMIYFGALLAFFIYMLLLYIWAEPMEVVQMTHMDNLRPINVTISTLCSDVDSCSSYTVTGHYDNSKCGESNFQREISSPFGIGEVSAIVCYSRSNNDGVTIDIPFNNTATLPYITITLTAPTYKNDLVFDTVLEPSQVKAIYLSQTKYFGYGRNTATYEPYVGDQMYAGRAPDASMASLSLRLQQYGYTSKRVGVGSVGVVIGAVGGFSAFIFPLIMFFRGWSNMFYRCFSDTGTPLGTKLWMMYWSVKALFREGGM